MFLKFFSAKRPKVVNKWDDREEKTWVYKRKRAKGDLIKGRWNPAKVPKNLSYLHVIHHKLIGQFTPILRIRHFLVHKTVKNRNATIGTESRGNLFIKRGEMTTRGLVTKLSHSNDLLVIFDGKAQNRPESAWETSKTASWNWRVELSNKCWSLWNLFPIKDVQEALLCLSFSTEMGVNIFELTRDYHIVQNASLLAYLR